MQFVTFDVIVLILLDFKGIVVTVVTSLLVNCDVCPVVLVLVHQFILVPMLRLCWWGFLENVSLLHLGNLVFVFGTLLSSKSW